MWSSYSLHQRKTAEISNYTSVFINSVLKHFTLINSVFFQKLTFFINFQSALYPFHAGGSLQWAWGRIHTDKEKNLGPGTISMFLLNPVRPLLLQHVITTPSDIPVIPSLCPSSPTTTVHYTLRVGKLGCRDFHHDPVSESLITSDSRIKANHPDWDSW